MKASARYVDEERRRLSGVLAVLLATQGHGRRPRGEASPALMIPKRIGRAMSGHFPFTVLCHKLREANADVSFLPHRYNKLRPFFAEVSQLSGGVLKKDPDLASQVGPLSSD